MTGASLNPADFSEGGGLIDNVDAVINDAAFTIWDYDQPVNNRTTLALRLTLGYTGPDGEPAQALQYYSAGDPKFFVPSEDGKMAIPVGNKTALNSNTNLGQLLMALINAGFTGKLGDDISVIVGVNAHWQRVAQPKRDGLPSQQGQAANDRPKTLLVPVKVHAATGAKAAPKTAAKTTPKTAPAAATPPAAAAADADGDADEALATTIMEVLQEKGAMSKAKLLTALFKPLAAFGAQRNAMLKRAGDDTFLTDGGPWGFDGENVGTNL